ncbi:MAG: PrsW family glutamic-type intramembrane protease [Eubacteriales bacterium]|nr:PrsW family glutamic-type intramembrane protease [Eubacteriales bacterium]
MIILLLGFIVSLLPSIALYLWFKGFKSDQLYKDNCKSTFIAGVIAVFPILALSALFALIKVFLLSGVSPFLYAAFHNFIVLALSEELVKYYTGRKTIDRMIGTVSRLDLIVFMGIVGIAFGIAEAIPYAIGASPLVMIIRGVSVGHGVYGMMTGYFLGKIMEGGSKSGLPAILVSWLYHGLYDFGLSDEFSALGDWSAIIPVSLAFGELVLLIVFIVFIRRARNNEKYTAPLFPDAGTAQRP